MVTNLLMHACNAEKVISHPAVQGVSLTGSERAGSAVAAIAGKYLKKCVMELGGSDAFIVTSDTSIPDIIDIALMAKMFNAGQVCTGAKRYIIVKDKYQEFLKAFSQGMAALKAGDPTALETDYAPMVNEQEADTLLSIIEQAREQGATVYLGGQRLPMKGAWLEPTILTDVTPQMDIYKLELFGPVAMVFCVENEEQAIRLANDTCFGLSSSVMCRNLENAQILASKLETGVAFINNMTISEPGLSFGGIKNSGFGRELGRAGVEEFVNQKLIRIFYE
ncbi:aldehyde dehydrogenase family protein [Ewingella americana]|uniref:aldehyde dehydrogenase family protein n=1 Tax=Ewingella americana TaxID=41202 RepID=UPI0016397ACE|nr:aldehyde dehydrogenase family protein [Ewingella americana]QMV54152.1 aldehyde dehydrogenase family protein [Ewingella americana]